MRCGSCGVSASAAARRARCRPAARSRSGSRGRRRLLREPADARARRNVDRAASRRQLAADGTKQRGLAGAVAADEADRVPGPISAEAWSISRRPAMRSEMSVKDSMRAFHRCASQTQPVCDRKCPTATNGCPQRSNSETVRRFCAKEVSLCCCPAHAIGATAPEAGEAVPFLWPHLVRSRSPIAFATALLVCGSIRSALSAIRSGIVVRCPCGALED